MALPYLKSNNPINPELNKIGTGYRNYFRYDMPGDVKARIAEHRRYPEVTGTQRYKEAKKVLGSQSPYGVSQSAELLEANAPGTHLYVGEPGMDYTFYATGRADAGGFHARLTRPEDGKIYTTAVADELDNLSALQVLGHELAHYRLGHSTVPQVPQQLPTSGDYTYRPGRAAQDLSYALKEVEAETTAAEIMNRLGYGYKPGVLDRSAGYISSWSGKLAPEDKEYYPGLLERVNAVATELVPQPIKRFGPLSTRVANLVI